MKKLLFGLLLSVPAFATNASYEAEVVSALNPHVAACVAGHDHYADVVSSCHAGSAKVSLYAVANQGDCSHNDLVQFVGNHQVKVVVGHNALSKVGLNYNQTLAQCVRVVKVGGKLKKSVVARVRVGGLQVSSNRRAVLRVVDNCR